MLFHRNSNNNDNNAVVVTDVENGIVDIKNDPATEEPFSTSAAAAAVPYIRNTGSW